MLEIGYYLVISSKPYTQVIRSSQLIHDRSPEPSYDATLDTHSLRRVGVEKRG
jgi:hypothetical protein